MTNEEIEKRADAAYERGIADTQARFSQEIREAYERGQLDERALTNMGFPATPEQKRERAAQLLREANEQEGYDVQ